jgi:hypothetical protein
MFLFFQCHFLRDGEYLPLTTSGTGTQAPFCGRPLPLLRSAPTSIARHQNCSLSHDLKLLIELHISLIHVNAFFILDRVDLSIARRQNCSLLHDLKLLSSSCMRTHERKIGCNLYLSIKTRCYLFCGWFGSVYLAQRLLFLILHKGTH